jgi:hypothetical protein
MWTWTSSKADQNHKERIPSNVITDQEGHITRNCKTLPCGVQVKATAGTEAKEPLTNALIKAMVKGF